MKGLIDLEANEKKYILEEPMTTPCAEMLIRLQGIAMPSIGAAEFGYGAAMKVLFERMSPKDFLDISKTIVKWCKDDKSAPLDYETEFRGAEGMKTLYILLREAIKAMYDPFLVEMRKDLNALTAQINKEAEEKKKANMTSPQEKS